LALNHLPPTSIKLISAIAGFLAFAIVLDPLRLFSPVLDRCLGLFAQQFVETFGQDADQLVMSVQCGVDVSETVIR
jgi:hypothetical protein